MKKNDLKTIMRIIILNILFMVGIIGIFSIPCIVVIKNGEETDRHIGMLPKSAVENLIK